MDRTENLKKAWSAPRGKTKNPVEKAKENPNSLRFAINAKCYECEGGDTDPNVRWRIGNCVCEDTCPLWNVRPYQKQHERDL